MNAKQEKIHQDLVKDLSASEDKLVMDALTKVKSVGTPRLIPELLQLWFKSNGEVHQATTDLLYSLKDKEVIPVLFSELDKTKKESEREKILSIFWNAGLEPKNHLSKLVHLGINGEFMEAVECLTIIENMEPPFPEDQLMDALLTLKEYFSNNPTGDKVTIIRSIATFVQYTDETQVDI